MITFVPVPPDRSINVTLLFRSTLPLFAVISTPAARSISPALAIVTVVAPVTSPSRFTRLAVLMPTPPLVDVTVEPLPDRYVPERPEGGRADLPLFLLRARRPEAGEEALLNVHDGASDS